MSEPWVMSTGRQPLSDYQMNAVDDSLNNDDDELQNDNANEA
jgi:hypothetical protein